MIRFSLNCAHDHEFEGWFRSSDSFEEQVEAGAITCPVCGDTQVRKAVMAPAVVTRSGGRGRARGEGGDGAAAGREVATAAAAAGLSPEQAKAAMMMQMLRKVREHVEQNFENVGPRFAEEARRIHYGESEARDIFGQASPAEAKELVEEGIQVRPLPDLPKLDG